MVSSEPKPPSKAMNIFSWIWISLFCEILYRTLVGAFKKNKSIQGTPDSENNPEQEKEEKINFEISPKKNPLHHRKCGRGLAGIADHIKSMCGRKEEEENYSRRDDTYLQGLTREDKISGSVKISSFYDKNGKMVFQRETSLPPPTVNDIKNTSQSPNNPSFFIRPQDATDSNVDEQVDKKFGKIYGVGKELGDLQKTFVDENINKTFKDIYDMVLPSVF